MFVSPPQPGPASPPHASPAPTGPAADRARRLAACADSTLNLLTVVARAVHRLAEPETIHNEQRPQTPATPDAIATLVKAHTMLARSLRQTSALEAKLEALAAAGPLAFAEAETRRVQLRKTLIRKVENAIDHNARPEARENLLHEFYERLDDPDLGAEFDLDLLANGAQPTVADACYDLGIVAAALTFPRRTPEALTRLLARAAGRPAATGPP